MSDVVGSCLSIWCVSKISSGATQDIETQLDKVSANVADCVSNNIKCCFTLRMVALQRKIEKL
jgi:hypothetical protein